VSVEQNKATERRLYDEVWNKGNMSVVPQLVSAEYLYRGPEGDFKGPDGYVAMVTGMRAVLPDLHFTIDDMVGEGDKLAYRITGHGTYTGKLGDVMQESAQAAMSYVRSRAEALGLGRDFYQKVDILVNNAGISQLSFTATEDLPVGEWDKIMAVNLKGTFLCCKHRRTKTLS
jgi:NAD(P)-dependent dehydrogenase (short-subunit alcohol dehydrogenase family)